MTIRTVNKTLTGFVVYGAFTATMRLDFAGNVTYCNMTPDSAEYRAMLKAYKQSI